MPTAPFARNHCPSHSLSFAVAAAPTSKIKVSQSLSIAFTLTKSSGAAGGRPGKLDFKDGGKDKVKLDAIPPEVYDPAVVEAEEPITEMLVHCTLRHARMTKHWCAQFLRNSIKVVPDQFCTLHANTLLILNLSK